MKKFVVTLTSLLMGLFISLSTLPTLTHASAEFSTAFTSTYVIDEKGDAIVTHQIDITNKLAHIYTTKYTLAVGSDRLQSIKATVSGSSIDASVNQNGAATTITLLIPTPVIGKDQTTHIEISYHSPDIASILGDTLTINIPRMSKANEAESFTRIIKLPLSGPELSTLSPQEHGEQLTPTQRIYTFSGHPNESVTMLFGKSVTYQLKLEYTITNPTVSAADTEIALPPDTAYQQIILDSLDPAPSKIRLDQDGNWLAQYTLKARETKTIKALVFATVSALPTFYDPSLHDGKALTAGRTYWDTGKSLVADLAKQLKTPKNIYTYLVDNLTYNYNRVKVGTDRLGALAALTNPSDALCTEFTDSFIALARSANIKSREINGYAYSVNTALRPLGLETDILHSWPEYYDEASFTWIAVDPTWGNTTGGVNYFDKLDFNHITFIRRGEESDYPLPAGVYKSSGNTKQIQVEVASPVERRESSLVRDKVIKNTGNVALINAQVGYLPPYGELTLKDGELPSVQSRAAVYTAGAILILLASVALFLLRRKK